MTGMKSGTRSMGNARYASATKSRLRTPDGSVASVARSRSRRTMSGMTRLASARFIPRGRTTMRSTSNSSHVNANAAATPTNARTTSTAEHCRKTRRDPALAGSRVSKVNCVRSRQESHPGQPRAHRFGVDDVLGLADRNRDRRTEGMPEACERQQGEQRGDGVGERGHLRPLVAEDAEAERREQ